MAKLAKCTACEAVLVRKFVCPQCGDEFCRDCIAYHDSDNCVVEEEGD